jgi:high-affinity nickel permease
VPKVYYNIAITALSVIAAPVIGTVERLPVPGTRLRLTGGIRNRKRTFNSNQRPAGFVTGFRHFAVTGRQAAGHSPA